MTTAERLDQYLSPAVREWIEQRFYARVNAQAKLEQLASDPEFLRDPEHHAALWPDHGIVHVRDVAQQVLTVIDNTHGVLIPTRNAQRLAFMKAYGVMVAYVHDIGMTDFTRLGRAMHPEYATQAVLGTAFDSIIDAIWDANQGDVAGRLASMAEHGLLDQAPRQVLREMLAMANCHSKSKMPVEVLNDPAALQENMLVVVRANLSYLYYLQRARGARQALQRAEHSLADIVELDRLSDAVRDAEQALVQLGRSGQNVAASQQEHINATFQWLLGEYKENRDLVDDVIDTLRALRCADALRQRGTVLKTSGGYELFVDQRTANTVCALRHGSNQLYLVELTNRINAGEANIAGSEVDRDGNLRISFHRGAFPSREVVEHAAHNAAVAVNDIQTDVIESFKNTAKRRDSLKCFDEMEIHLEGVDDNMAFAHLVLRQMRALNPNAAARARVVPSLQNASARELQRYMGSTNLDWDQSQRNALLERIRQTGHRVSAIDPQKAFEYTRLVSLEVGEVLIDAGTPACFVYIPLGDGLQVIPLGGYSPFTVQAWMPLGNTGVIRGATRNATVIAGQDVTLLMIPREVFLNHWHQPYSLAEFTQEIDRQSAKAEPLREMQGDP